MIESATEPTMETTNKLDTEQLSKLCDEHGGTLPDLEKVIDLDVKYMDIENEYLEKWAELQQKFEERQTKLIEERSSIIERGGLGPHFWLTVLQGHPIFNDEIQECDIPVLELLTNIRVEHLPDPSNKRRAGFKVIFEFKDEDDKLPFKNKELVRVFETGLESEFLTEINIQNIFMESEIEWKSPDRNITVAMKKPKGKKKQAEQEDVPSFFRSFFRTIDIEHPDDLQDMLEKGLVEMGIDHDELEGEEELEQAYEDALAKITDDAYEMALCLRDNIIPFAVRWYTGEACPMVDSDGPEDDAKKKEECKQQ